METIRQAEGDFVTSSLLPNPTVQVNGVFLPLRTFTPASPAARRSWTSSPRSRSIGISSANVRRRWPMRKLGVAVSNADYCDQVRQRLANTASAFYDVLEAQAMLKLAEEDLASLEHVERITLAGVKFGGSGTIEAERIRLSVLDAQREVCTRADHADDEQGPIAGRDRPGLADAAIRACGRSGRRQAGGADVVERGNCRGRAEPAGHHLLAAANRQGPQRHRSRTDEGPPHRGRPPWDTRINSRSATAWPTPPRTPRRSMSRSRSSIAIRAISPRPNRCWPSRAATCRRNSCRPRPTSSKL